jgi:hypothetical protein
MGKDTWKEKAIEGKNLKKKENKEKANEKAKRKRKKRWEKSEGKCGREMKSKKVLKNGHICHDLVPKLL